MVEQSRQISSRFYFERTPDRLFRRASSAQQEQEQQDGWRYEVSFLPKSADSQKRNQVNSTRIHNVYIFGILGERAKLTNSENSLKKTDRRLIWYVSLSPILGEMFEIT